MRTVSALLSASLLAGCAGEPPTACSPPLKPALEVDLYFGRGTVRGEVKEAEWAAFLAEEVTPRFPDGLSVTDVAGQWRDQSSGRIGREHSKRVTIVVLDAPAHAPKVAAIVETYRKRYDQQSVLHTEYAVCVAF